MGYISRPIYRQLEWGFDCYSSDSLVITSVASDIGPFNGTLPTWTGNIILAYMDVLVGQVINTAVGANTLWTDSYIQLKPTAGAYGNAFKFSAGQFTMSPADKMNAGRFYGNINIANIINSIGSGGGYTWQWHDAKAGANNINIKGAFQPILRVVFQ
jgi:hypothetical protein